jgi:hypothetical protein
LVMPTARRSGSCPGVAGKTSCIGVSHRCKDHSKLPRKNIIQHNTPLQKDAILGGLHKHAPCPAGQNSFCVAALAPPDAISPLGQCDKFITAPKIRFWRELTRKKWARLRNRNSRLRIDGIIFKANRIAN